jgi:uncharacterized membrane protein YhaH (DUF805 family)
MTDPRPAQAPSAADRPPYAHALGAAAAALLLYVVTLAPTTWFWDTSEYIATAHILGIPHPPGNPLFVVVGRVWSILLGLTGMSVPVRINLFAAVTSAAATGFFFLVAHRILAGWMARDRDVGVPWALRLPLAGAWCGALLGATSYTVWNQSNVNEKVYTLSVLIIALVSWLALRWRDRKDEAGSGWYLVLALYIMVLGSTNHLMSVLPAPALGLMILLEKPRILLDSRLLTRGVLAVVLGLSFNFFLPLRSAQQPLINEGEPVCESIGGAAVAIYTNGRTGCEALAYNLRREQYGKASVMDDPTDPRGLTPRGGSLIAHQYHNYFQYFDWQWARGLSESSVPGNSRLPVTLLVLGLGLLGIVVSVRAGPGWGVYMGTLAATVTVLLVFYLNFRYGFSLAPDGTPREMREVRERDYFFIASFHLWGFLTGIGIAAAWRWAAGRVPSGRGFALASPILLVAFVPLVFNWGWADRSGDYSARDWAWNLLQSVEPYGILFTNGDNDTFPLWYLQEVEGVRRDVTVIVTQYLYTPWYPRQLQYHTTPGRQRPYEPEAGAPEGVRAIWPEPAQRPTRAITELPREALDPVDSGPLPADLTVTLGGQPIRYEQGTWLGRGERLALAIIRDAMDERPIHFASTGGLAQQLGLDRWAVRQGLSSKLRIEPLAEVEGLVRASEMLGGDWVDLESSLRLSREVHSYRGLYERIRWQDQASVNIPLQFYFMYAQMADAAVFLGREESLAEEFAHRAEGFLVTYRGEPRGTP